jgi:hypothetical protein
LCLVGFKADVPRQIRIEYPGAIYHVMSRGGRRQAIAIAQRLNMDSWTSFSKLLYWATNDFPEHHPLFDLHRGNIL